MKGEFELEGVTIQLNVVDGSVHASVIDFIRNREVELVVMGTRGASGVREWMVGSNTEKIVRNSPVPVIAIKNYHPGWTISDIVFPNTLDIEDQEDLVTNVKALQHLFQAKVHIIWVNTPAVNKPENEIRKKLQAFAQRFMFTNFTINIFNYTDEEAGIVAFTNQINADMIAMGTHGLKGIAHLLAGSVAEDVVNHVACPVWTYCAKSARALSRTKNHHEISDRRSK